jgi:parvulin-like peptidyl-prolyl isomerase
MKQPASIRLGVVIVAGALVLVGAAAFLTGGHKRNPDDVAVLVNGEAIYERDLDQAMPPQAFGATLESLKATKLRRLVDQMLRRQFLRAQGIVVPEANVQQALAETRRNPLAPSCPCCAYGSFEQYLAANCYTLDEYAEKLRNELGFQQLTESLWQKAYPTEQARTALMTEWRRDVQSGYCKLSHILFIEKPGNMPAEARAQLAGERLEQGESFSKLAAELSDDAATARQGGALGCFDAFQSPIDSRLMKELRPLAVGGYSAPLQSNRGWHIFRREAITDEDVLHVAKNSFVQRRTFDAYSQIDKAAKIQSVGRQLPEGSQRWE